MDDQTAGKFNPVRRKAAQRDVSQDTNRIRPFLGNHPI